MFYLHMKNILDFLGKKKFKFKAESINEQQILHFMHTQKDTLLEIQIPFSITRWAIRRVLMMVFTFNILHWHSIQFNDTDISLRICIMANPNRHGCGCLGRLTRRARFGFDLDINILGWTSVILCYAPKQDRQREK